MVKKLVVLGWGIIADLLCSFPNVIGYVKLNDFETVYSSKTRKKICRVGKNLDGIIGIGKNTYKEEMARAWEEAGYSLGKLVHPLAYIHSDARLGKGSVVMPLAFIDDKSKIGECTIIGPQSAVRVGSIGNFCHLSIQSKVLPSSCLEDYVTLEAGAIVLENRIVGKGSVIGANAVVTKNILPYHRYTLNISKNYNLRPIRYNYPLTAKEKQANLP